MISNRISTNFFFSALLVLFGYGWINVIHAESTKNPDASKKDFQDTKKEVWITIFVHGMMSIKHHISCGNVVRFLYDDVEDCVYATTVSFMRKNEYFFQNQAMQEVGLKPVDINKYRGNGAGALAFTMNNLAQLFGLPETENYYYTFGWSGLLSAKARYKEAIILFKELETLIASYQEKNISPKLRIYAYSHGGNVALNLGAVHQIECPTSSLSIDELILVGMPVQTETECFVSDPLFKRVFNVYSRADRVQTLDLFSANRFFSDYLFRKHSTFIPPKNLTQIRVKVTVPKMMALCDDYYFQKTMNFNDRRISFGNSKYLQDMSPGHAELWFFGWTPLNYRANFPLYPLPAVAFLPVCIDYLNTSKLLVPPTTPLIFDLRPKNHSILMRLYGEKKPLAVIPFCNPGDLSCLHASVLRYSPPTYSEEQYRGYIREAYEQALACHKETMVIKDSYSDACIEYDEAE